MIVISSSIFINYVTFIIYVGAVDPPVLNWGRRIHTEMNTQLCCPSQFLTQCLSYYNIKLKN